MIMLNARYRQFSFTPKCAEWDYDEENYFNVDNYENHNNDYDEISYDDDNDDILYPQTGQYEQDRCRRLPGPTGEFWIMMMIWTILVVKATDINSLENLLAVSRIKKTQGLDVDQITCNVNQPLMIV